MEQVAQWVEVEQNGYLWWAEEYMQLFSATNFVGRGEHRILLCGSSEGREGFLFDVMEADLPGFEVFQNSYSAGSMTTLLIMLDYIEKAYGSTAMPDKIVLGITPWFVTNRYSINESHVPTVINKYSPYYRVDRTQGELHLVPKNRLEAMVARYRLLTQQSRRYQGALRGVFRAIVTYFRPDLADAYWLRRGLVPSKYHHLPRRSNKNAAIHWVMRSKLPSIEPGPYRETMRKEFAKLQEFTKRNGIELYVVNLPQSKWLIDEYFGASYDENVQATACLIGDTPFLDLGRFLSEEEMFDLLHPTLDGSRKVSRRVAQFVRETEAQRLVANEGAR
jgi:hypothetical protein